MGRMHRPNPKGTSVSGTDPVAHQVPKRFQTVFPADLFAFLIGSSIIMDRGLVNAPFASQRNLTTNLNLHAKIIGRDVEGAQDLPREHLVAGLDIGQRLVE